MIGENFNLQIYLAYLEYKLWSQQQGYYICTFDTFRKIGLESADTVHRWLMGDLSDNRSNDS